MARTNIEIMEKDTKVQKQANTTGISKTVSGTSKNKADSKA
jgi:hypothetical protein